MPVPRLKRCTSDKSVQRNSKGKIMKRFFLKMKTVFLILLFLCTVNQASFYEDHAQGWFWYEDPKIYEKEASLKKKVEKADASLTPFQKAVQDLKDYKQKIEERKALALMNPTFNTVRDYMMIQKEMSDRAEEFSQIWEKVMLKTPELNPEINNPSPQYLRHVKNDEKRLHHDQILKSAAQRYGLFFFISQKCPYCQAFAPIVKRFADAFGFHVMVIHMQGDPDEEIAALFKIIRTNNGMAGFFGIHQTPALMAYNSQTQDVIPLSYGATSMDKLILNFIALVGEKDA